MPTPMECFHGKCIEHVGPTSWPPDVPCFGFCVDIILVPVVPYELQWHTTEAVKKVTQEPRVKLLRHCRATKQTHIGHLDKL
jgi:hypothetical protein